MGWRRIGDRARRKTEASYFHASQKWLMNRVRWKDRVTLDRVIFRRRFGISRDRKVDAIISLGIGSPSLAMRIADSTV